MEITIRKFVIKRHAQDMMVARGVTKEQIRRTIKMGSRTVQTDGYLSIYTYLAVAWKIRGDKYIIKTVKILD